jgi:prepilin-type processing-associated H-X9-DG protein
MGGVLPKSYRGRSFYVPLLPFLDQPAAYHAFNMSVGYSGWESEYRTIKALRLSVLACPSDPMIGTTGTVSYAGNAGGGYAKYGDNGTIGRIGGDAIRTSSITDGLSRTALVAEWLVEGISVGSWDVKRTIFDVHIRKTPKLDFDPFVAVCRALDSSRAQPQHGKGQDWLDGNPSYTLYNHAVEPDGPSCMEDGAVQTGAFTAGSLHGGTHVLFADGHVYSVRPQVQLDVWRALGSRNGGEAVSDASF